MKNQIDLSKNKVLLSKFAIHVVVKTSQVLDGIRPDIASTASDSRFPNTTSHYHRGTKHTRCDLPPATAPEQEVRPVCALTAPNTPNQP